MDRSFVGIPAHNEENTIASVVMKVKEHVDTVLVVDDGSTDSTARLAEKAGAKVVRHDSNKGYGAALRTLFHKAKKEDAHSMLILDADGQHPESEITNLLSKVLEGEADVAIGSRFLHPEHKKQVPAYRRFGIKVLTKLTPTCKAKNENNGKKQSITDGQSGFRAYSKEAIQTINPKESGMGASAEILMEARSADLDVLEVPIDVSYDGDTSHEGPVEHAMGVIGSIVRYVETKHSLLSFGLPGLIAFLAGIVMGYRTIEMFNTYGNMPVGHLVLTSLLLIGGVAAGMTGLILHAIMNAQRRGFE